MSFQAAELVSSRGTGTDPVGGYGPRRAIASADLLEERRYESVTRFILRVTLLAVGFDYTVGPGITIGLVALVVFLPLWLTVLKEYSGASTTLALGLAAVPVGYLLARASSADHLIDSANQLSTVLLLLSGIAAFVVVLWARTRLPIHEVIFFYAAGVLADAVLFTPRSWKFDLAVPVILVAVSLAERTKRVLAPMVVVLGLGALSVLNDGRSLFASCVLAAVLVLWQGRGDEDTPREQDTDGTRGSARTARRTSSWKPIAVMVVVAVVFYQAVTMMLTSGLLGTELQQRSVQQIEASGSLLIGGRPEWSATRELVRIRPWGYGLGVVPSWSDLQAGKVGFHSINTPESSYGYLERFMLGGTFKLHSILADFWVAYGLVGFLFGFAVLVGLIRGLADALARRTASVGITFAGILGIWYMIFGTPFSNWVEVAFALGLTMAVRERPLRGPIGASSHVLATGSGT